MAAPATEGLLAVVASASTVVVIAAAIEIAVMVAIPAVIVLKPAAISIPVTREELSSFIARAYPNGALIGRPGPIASMPLVVVSNRIPIAFHPDEFRTRSDRLDANHARRRGRTNSDSDGNLRRKCGGASEQDRGKQYCSGDGYGAGVFHGVFLLPASIQLNPGAASGLHKRRKISPAERRRPKKIKQVVGQSAWLGFPSIFQCVRGFRLAGIGRRASSVRASAV
jgi:hypothetical protein